MSGASATLRPANIVSVDVFGFARDTEDDRHKIALAFEALTARLEATAARHLGRVFSGAADGFFLELPSAEAAVVAGDEIANGPWPPVRVGVHEGPVEALPSGELAGKAVQVAARIQQAADKGAVLVSEDVRRDLHGPLAKRLHKDASSVKFDRPEDNTAVYKLAYVEAVDETALKARNRQRAIRIAAGAVAFAGPIVKQVVSGGGAAVLRGALDTVAHRSGASSHAA